MNPEVWGPPFWFTLHTIAMSYPTHPNDVTKKKYYELIQNIPLFLPNVNIGNYFIRLLDKYPVTPYLSSRMSFMKWVHYLHNKINAALEKDEISFDDSLERYYKNYVPKESLKRKKSQEKKIIIDLGIMMMLIIMIVYCCKK